MPEFKPYLTDTEVEQVQTMSHDLWSGGKTLQKRISFLKECLSYSNGELLNMCGIVDPKGAVIASLKRYYTQLQFGQNLYPAIGLGAIFTQESFRKQGWAKKLIEMVVEEGTEEGYTAFYLFSDIDPDYYGKLGFQPLPSENFEVDTQLIPNATPLEIRLCTEKEIPWLLKMHNLKWQNTLSVKRDEKYWALFKQLNSGEPIYQLLQKGEPVGYAIYEVKDKAAWLEELVIPDTLEANFLSHLKGKLIEAGAKSLKGWNHRSVLAGLPKEISKRTKSIPMVRFIGQKPEAFRSERSYFSSLDHF